jgi:pimeloyl-ACP methyl ester carboxylesterase
MKAPTRRSGVVNQARAIAAWRGAHRLARLRVPTTIVHGDKDVLLPVDNGRRLDQAIPDARYIAIAGVGHIPPYEALSRVAEIVRRRGGTPGVTDQES